MSNLGTGTFESRDNDNILQAVIVVDTFSEQLSPICNYMPSCLIPLANHPLLEYTLECLFSAGVQEVILLCPSFAEQIKTFLRAQKWPGMVISIVVSEGSSTLGDVMRDLDGKALIRSDFILLSGNLVGNLQLLPALDHHKRIQKTDKGGVMTLMFKECGKRLKAPGDDFTVAVDSKTNRVLLYSKTLKSRKKIDIPMELILETSEIDLRCDLEDTHVSICSLAVPPLFSDNFDFQTREDFLRGLLVQDEVLTSTIYAYFLPADQYGATVNSWAHYQDITHDVIHRWVFPFALDMFSDEPYFFKRNNIYTQRNITFSQGCKLEEDVVIASGSSVGQNSSISRSVVGKNCQIGANVVIEDSYIMNCAIIKDGCRITHTMIGQSCVINDRATVTDGSVLAPGVVVDADKHISGLKLQPHPPIGCVHSEALSSKAYLFKSSVDDDSDLDSDDSEVMTGLRISKNEAEDDDEWEDSTESDGNDEFDHSLSPMPEDTNLFYSEVVDSLVRGYEDSLPCNNLMLEINSSRYAYNVSMSEVTVNVVQAILRLPRPAGPIWPPLLDHLNYFTPILTNYVRSESAQHDCLLAIEDTCSTHPDIFEIIVKLIHWLYEQDILSEEEILSWHQHPPCDVDRDIATRLRKQVVPFIKWLKEAEEQSDNDDADDDESDDD